STSTWLTGQIVRKTRGVSFLDAENEGTAGLSAPPPFRSLLAYLLRGHARGHRLHHAPRHRCRRFPNACKDASHDSQDQPDEEAAGAAAAEEREEQDDHASWHMALRLHPQHHGAD